MADLKISQLAVATVAPALSYIPIAASGANWAIPATAAAIGAAPAANGVTNGDSHDHSGGDGAQIAHSSLSGIGTNTHAQIDTHIANTSNPHSVTAAQLSLGTTDNVTHATLTATATSAVGAITGTVTSTASSNVTNYPIGGQFYNYSIVNSGFTNSGQHRAMSGVCYRNSVAAGTDDSGTLANMYGMQFSFGHSNTNASATPQTTTAYGINLTYQNRTGTITNAYQLYLGVGFTEGTTTNLWGIYQDSTVPVNYLGGKTGIGTNAPTGKLDVNDSVIRVRTAKTPASATAAGNQGDIAWDSSYIYVCTATNTWKRVAIATW